MSGCPYTWFRNLLGSPSKNGTASSLRVKVEKNHETVVDVTLPAKSAGWLIDLIPSDVVAKIKQEGIPIEEIQADLAAQPILLPQNIFKLEEFSRSVIVWLE